MLLKAAKYVQNEQQNVNNLQLSREYLANWVNEDDIKVPSKLPSPEPLPNEVVDDKETQALFEAGEKENVRNKIVDSRYQTSCQIH